MLTAESKVVIDFGTSKESATILTQAAHAMEEDQPQAHSKQVITRMLYNHRTDLEEINHSICFLMRRRSVTLTEIQRLVGLIPLCDIEDVPRCLQDELNLCPGAPSEEAEDGFISA